MLVCILKIYDDSKPMECSSNIIKSSVLQQQQNFTTGKSIAVSLHDETINIVVFSLPPCALGVAICAIMEHEICFFEVNGSEPFSKDEGKNEDLATF